MIAVTRKPAWFGRAAARRAPRGVELCIPRRGGLSSVGRRRPAFRRDDDHPPRRREYWRRPSGSF